MLWYPFLRRVDQKWVNAFLAPHRRPSHLPVRRYCAGGFGDCRRGAGRLPGCASGGVRHSVLSLGVLRAVSRRRGGAPLTVATLIALRHWADIIWGKGWRLARLLPPALRLLGSFLVIGFHPAQHHRGHWHCGPAYPHRTAEIHQPSFGWLCSRAHRLCWAPGLVALLSIRCWLLSS